MAEHRIQKWILDFFNKEPKEAVEVLAMVAQGVWLGRNKLCFENKVMKRTLIISKATSLLQSFQQANALARPTRELAQEANGDRHGVKKTAAARAEERNTQNTLKNKKKAICFLIHSKIYNIRRPSG